MRDRNWGLFAIAILMGAHALAVSFMLPSSFIIVAYAWGWVATTAFFKRLEAAKAMAATMTVLLSICAAVVNFTPLGQGDLRAFFSLALFPSLVAWACVYVYASYLEQARGRPTPTLDEMLQTYGDAGLKGDVNIIADERQRFMQAMIDGAAASDEHRLAS